MKHQRCWANPPRCLHSPRFYYGYWRTHIIYLSEQTKAIPKDNMHDIIISTSVLSWSSYHIDTCWRVVQDTKCIHICKIYKNCRSLLVMVRLDENTSECTKSSEKDENCDFVYKPTAISKVLWILSRGIRILLVSITYIDLRCVIIIKSNTWMYPFNSLNVNIP